MIKFNVERKTGNLLCATTLLIPGKGVVNSDMRFVLDSKGWHMLPR